MVWVLQMHVEIVLSMGKVLLPGLTTLDLYMAVSRVVGDNLRILMDVHTMVRHIMVNVRVSPDRL